MKPCTKLNRRELLVGLGLAATSAPLSALLGCSGTTGSSSTGTPHPATDAGEEPSAPWATGGTAAMTGSYPDPFASGMGPTCTLTAAAMLGPCYEPSIERKDLSEGQGGLPTRLAFLVVDESCVPISNAEIDVWHAAPRGVYSGTEVPAMCTLGDVEASKARYFRGRQKTDAQGRADFDTCFPGWYPGRTVHIHFTVRVNGKEALTSQLGFDDRLVDELVATQPLYQDRGPRDTTNATDGIITGEYVFQSERQRDGALLAWKALVVKTQG